MLIRWEIDDGYAGKSRPQYTEIPDDELEGLTKGEREKLIEEYVEDDFVSRISWYMLKAVEETTDGFGNLTALGEELRMVFRDLSLEIPMSATELANIGAIAGQLSIAGEDIEKFTELVAKIGVTTNLSAEEAATAFARLMSIMGTNLDQMDEMASALVYLGNNTAAMETEIIRLGLRLAGTASLVGMSEKGLLGLAAAVAALQIPAERAGTALTRTLIQMSNAIAGGGDDLKTFAQISGLTVEEFARLFEENAEVAILSFVEGLVQAEKQGVNVFAVLKDLGLGGIRVQEVLLKMSAAHKEVRKSLELANAGWEENIALDRGFNLYADTTKSLLIKLKNAIVDIAISIFGALNPVIKEVAERFRAFAIAISILGYED